jgi:hypothetical protein
MSTRSPTTPASRKAQGRLAVANRDHGTDHPRTREAREAFKSEQYLARVQAAVASAPPLTPEQREQLRAILTTAPVVPELAEIGGATR